MDRKKLRLQLLIIVMVLIMIPFISMGFSALSTVLNINADLIVMPPADPIIGNYEIINNAYLNTTYRNNIKYITLENNINLPGSVVKVSSKQYR